MGKLKELLYEKLEQESDRKLAKILGISYEDLLQLDWEEDYIEIRNGESQMLRYTFSDDSPSEILEKSELINERVALIPTWAFDNYDYDEQYEAIVEKPDVLGDFLIEIDNLSALNSISSTLGELEMTLKRHLFIGAIATMETFLSETFVNLVAGDKEYFKNFILTHPIFEERKFLLKDIFTQYEKLQDTAKEVMLSTLYHNMAVVKNMFQDTFNIKFPDISKVSRHVSTRHDLVHRNGKTKKGEVITLDTATIEGTLEDVKSFVLEVANLLKIKNHSF